jgi:hypothetical protein
LIIGFVAFLLIGVGLEVVSLAVLLWILLAGVFVLRARAIRSQRSLLLVCKQGIAECTAIDCVDLTPWSEVADVQVGPARFDESFEAIKRIGCTKRLWHVAVVRLHPRLSKFRGRWTHTIDFAFCGDVEDALALTRVLNGIADKTSVDSCIDADAVSAANRIRTHRCPACGHIIASGTCDNGLCSECGAALPRSFRNNFV